MLLTAWTAVVSVVFLLLATNLMVSWHFLETGVDTLFGPTPLGLYALHPELQIGPLTFVVVAPLRLLHGTPGAVAGAVVGQLVGLAVLAQVRALVAPTDRAGRRRWLLLGLVFMAAWAQLAVIYGHLDDGLALLALAVALRAAKADRPFVAAVAIAAAIDCKPWALPFVALLLLCDRRRLPLAVLLTVALVAVAYLPFLLDPNTVRAARFTIQISATATIDWLGLASGRTPVWCRPAQLLGGLVLAALLARRGRWQSVLLAGVVLRLLLDPGTKSYYEAGLLLGTVVWDLTAVVPIATAVAVVGVQVPALLSLTPAVAAPMRGVALLLLLVLSLVPLPQRSRPAPLDVRRRRPSTTGARAVTV